MDDAGPPSLYIVVSYPYSLPRRFSIIQLDTSELQFEKAEPQAETTEQQMKETKLVENNICEIHLKPPINPPIYGCDALVGWLFSRPTEDLYMVPNWDFGEGYDSQTMAPLCGYKLNFTTGSLLPISPPKPSKPNGIVVNLRGRIYFFGYEWKGDVDSVFQCYDPEESSWSSLEPFPGDFTLRPIVATAVWGDTILFNLGYHHMCAYDARRKEWYKVGVDGERCRFIYGEAVVVEDTIYALDGFSDSLLSISIGKDPTNGHLVLKFSSDYCVPHMDPMDSPDLDEMVFGRTRHLVRMGKDSFCIVSSHNIRFDFIGHQNVLVSCIKVEGQNLKVGTICSYKVKLPEPGEYGDQFQVLLCFSLPRCKTTALKGERFNLEPFPASIPVQEEEDDPVQMQFLRKKPRKSD